MRKYLSLAAALSMVFVSAACSSSSGGAVKNQTKAAEGAETSKPKENDNKVELTYITTMGEQQMTPVVKAFEEKNPNIKIKMEFYPFRQYFETVEVKVGAKSTDVDLLDVDVPLVANYSVKGYLEPLDKLINPNLKSNWIDSAVQAGSYKGQLMAPPMNTSSQVLFYNKDIFEKKGVTPPPNDTAQRWTWDQVVEAAKKLTFDSNGNNQPNVFGFSFEQISRPYQILPLSQSLGAKAVSEDGLVATGYTNSPEAIKAGQFYYDLFNTWKVSPKIPVEQSTEYFKSGKVAMFIGGTWNIRNFTEAKLNYGFAPHPYFKDGKIVTPTGSWHIGVSKFSKNKAAAAKFIEFLTAGEGSSIWEDKTKGLPAHVDILKKIMEDKAFAEFPDNVNRLGAYEAQHTAVPRPLTPGYLEWESIVNKAYEDIKNGADPKKALDEAAAQVDRQLKKYTSAVK